MPGERAAGGVLSLVTFFAQALRRRSGANSEAGREAAEGRMPGVKKVTRSTAGRVEALHFTQKCEELDSGFRRNDGKRKDLDD
jgi:hypothetical protein